MADSIQIRPNPLVLAWVTNMSSSPNLYIEFSSVISVLFYLVNRRNIINVKIGTPTTKTA